jgi:serine/threonine-protein kinase RsbW
MTLNSDRKEIPRSEQFANELVDQVQWGGQKYNEMLLALSEAVTNAIVHGNAEDPTKKVRISAWMENRHIKIQIADEGPGFDPDQLTDPLKDQNLLKQGGRGVFLMRQYADEVKFSDGGSTVTLVFEKPEDK